GYEYALRTFRLVTNIPDIPAAGTPGDAGMGSADGGASSCTPFVLDPSVTGGLVAVTTPPQLVPQNGQTIAPRAALPCGVAVQGGLDRARLPTDTIARAGGLLEASQCRQIEDDPGGVPNLQVGVWSFPSISTTDPGSLLDNNLSTPLPALVFQDAFSIGQ